MQKDFYKDFIKENSISLMMIILLFCFLTTISWMMSINHRLERIEAETDDIGVIVELESPWFLTQTPKDGLMDALEYYDIPHKDIVYAQAVLETGNFNSKNCTSKNNLFGLYNSKKKSYLSFTHWIKSVEFYKRCFSERYTDTTENYYHFLQRIHYAKDPEYYKKVEQIRQDLKNE